MTRLMLTAIVLALTAGCGGRPARVDLGVDLYLHPDASSPEDLILQAAIRRKLVNALPDDSGAVYVRVIDGVVFLTGSVRSAQVKSRVQELAENIDVALDGQPLKPKAVRNDMVLR